MKKIYPLIVIIMVVILALAASTINHIEIEQLDDIGTVRITVNFYLPVEQEGIEEKVELISERPGTRIIKSLKWINPSTLEIIAVEEGLPKGFDVRLKVGPLKTRIPGIHKQARFRYKANIETFLVELSPVVGSKGPIEMSFSTPLSRQQLVKNLEVDFDYELVPGQIQQSPEGKIFQDTSRWQIIPREKLTSGKEYDVHFAPETGLSRGAGFHKTFKVAPIPKVIASEPKSNDTGVMLYTPIVIDFDEPMQEVSIEVEGMKGDIELEGKRAVYKPHSVFLPDEEYRVTVEGVSVFGEKLPTYAFAFTTEDMGDKYWVEVNLRPLQKLVVYRGKKLVRTMVASGGLPDPENATPLGLFYLKDRGERFFTERIQEGGLYWVRIKDNWLIHSMPRDKDDNIIPEELAKHGIPASHGCIRLKDEEAKWFYDNIPTGTPCYIHD